MPWVWPATGQAARNRVARGVWPRCMAVPAVRPAPRRQDLRRSTPGGEAVGPVRDAATRAGGPVGPPCLLQPRGAGHVVREDPLELRERPRKREIPAFQYVHPHRLPQHTDPTLHVVAVGDKRIGTVHSLRWWWQLWR